MSFLPITPKAISGSPCMATKLAVEVIGTNTGHTDLRAEILSADTSAELIKYLIAFAEPQVLREFEETIKNVSGLKDLIVNPRDGVSESLCRAGLEVEKEKLIRQAEKIAKSIVPVSQPEKTKEIPEFSVPVDNPKLPDNLNPHAQKSLKQKFQSYFDLASKHLAGLLLIPGIVFRALIPVWPGSLFKIESNQEANLPDYIKNLSKLISERYHALRNAFKRQTNLDGSEDEITNNSNRSIAAFLNRFLTKPTIFNPRVLSDRLSTNSVWIGIDSSGSLIRLDLFLKDKDPELYDLVYPKSKVKSFEEADVGINTAVIKYNCIPGEELTLPLNHNHELTGLSFYSFGGSKLNTDLTEIRIGMFGSAIVTAPSGAVKLRYAVRFKEQQKNDLSEIHARLAAILPVCHIHRDPRQQEFDRLVKLESDPESKWLSQHRGLGYKYCSEKIITHWIKSTGNLMVNAIAGSRFIICDSGSYYIATAANAAGFPTIIASGPNVSDEAEKARFIFPGHSINIIVKKDGLLDYDCTDPAAKYKFSLREIALLVGNSRFREIYHALSKPHTADEIYELAEELSFLANRIKRPWLEKIDHHDLRCTTTILMDLRQNNGYSANDDEIELYAKTDLNTINILLNHYLSTGESLPLLRHLTLYARNKGNSEPAVKALAAVFNNEKPGSEVRSKIIELVDAPDIINSNLRRLDKFVLLLEEADLNKLTKSEISFILTGLHKIVSSYHSDLKDSFEFDKFEHAIQFAEDLTQQIKNRPETVESENRNSLMSLVWLVNLGKDSESTRLPKDIAEICRISRLDPASAILGLPTLILKDLTNAIRDQKIPYLKNLDFSQAFLEKDWSVTIGYKEELFFKALTEFIKVSNARSDYKDISADLRAKLLSCVKKTLAKSDLKINFPDYDHMSSVIFAEMSEEKSACCYRTSRIWQELGLIEDLSVIKSVWPVVSEKKISRLVSDKLCFQTINGFNHLALKVQPEELAVPLRELPILFNLLFAENENYPLINSIYSYNKVNLSRDKEIAQILYPAIFLHAAACQQNFETGDDFIRALHCEALAAFSPKEAYLATVWACSQFVKAQNQEVFPCLKSDREKIITFASELGLLVHSDLESQKLLDKYGIEEESGSGLESLSARAKAIALVSAWLMHDEQIDYIKLPNLEVKLPLGDIYGSSLAGFRTYWYACENYNRDSIQSLEEFEQTADRMVDKYAETNKGKSPFIRFMNSEHGLLLSTANSGELHEISHYHLGDDIRRVNQKASARSSSVYINKYQNMGFNSVTMLIDGEWFFDKAELNEDRLISFFVYLKLLEHNNVPHKIMLFLRSGIQSVDSRDPEFMRYFSGFINAAASIRQIEVAATENQLHGAVMSADGLESLRSEIIIAAVADNNLKFNTTLLSKLRAKNNLINIKTFTVSGRKQTQDINEHRASDYSADGIKSKVRMNKKLRRRRAADKSKRAE